MYSEEHGFGIQPVNKVDKYLSDFLCPLCHKEVNADVCDGVVTMFNQDGDFHFCKGKGVGEKK